MKNKTFWAYFGIFTLCFIGGIVLFSSYFIVRVFGRVDFNAILFHLRFPLLDNENSANFIGDFILRVIIPSLFCAFCITFPKLIQKCVIWLYYWFLKAGFGKCVFAFVLFALCINVANNKLKITRYIKTQQELSSLYETHYKAFDSTALANFSTQNHQNLIVIFTESLESTFSAKNTPANGGGICIRPLAS